MKYGCLLNLFQIGRWLAKGDFTKWYPKMKLYRQSSLGIGDNVFKEIENDLLIKVCPK